MKRSIAAILAILTLGFAAPAQNNRPSLADQTTEIIGRIFGYLDGCTPYNFVDARGVAVTDLGKADPTTNFARGDFNIISYEWGVVYTAMLKLSETLGDAKYADYTYKRFKAIGDIYPYMVKLQAASNPSLRLFPLASPRFLDDCGAMVTSMMRATMKDPARSASFRPQLDFWYDFVANKEYRLNDGILARNRPTTNSVWLDDMYMGIPPIAYRGLLASVEGDASTASACYAEAVKQILLFKKYLWIPEKNLYRHGWIEGMSVHPNYHWARCNGWAILTMCDVLDVLPEDTPGRDEVLGLVRDFIAGVSSYQSPDGRWHQLLDKEESYLETSASAMFVYCIAHGILNGWLDRTAYQDVAVEGWRGVMTQVNERGQVENTCTGTGLGWTNTFYEHRPVSVYAAHGYGPVLLAAQEILKLVSQTN